MDYQNSLEVYRQKLESYKSHLECELLIREIQLRDLELKEKRQQLGIPAPESLYEPLMPNLNGGGNSNNSKPRSQNVGGCLVSFLTIGFISIVIAFVISIC